MESDTISDSKIDNVSENDNTISLLIDKYKYYEVCDIEEILDFIKELGPDAKHRIPYMIFDINNTYSDVLTLTCDVCNKTYGFPYATFIHCTDCKSIKPKNNEDICDGIDICMTCVITNMKYLQDNGHDSSHNSYNFQYLIGIYHQHYHEKVVDKYNKILQQYQ